jgi:hypothetical protein
VVTPGPTPAAREAFMQASPVRDRAVEISALLAAKRLL